MFSLKKILVFFISFKNKFFQKTDIIINPDFISNYRSVLIDKLVKEIKKRKLTYKILSNSKSYFNLDIKDKYLLEKEYIRSNPLFLFKNIIWQPKLLRSFLLLRPKIFIVWGEVTRINSWIILILRKLLFRESKIYLWTHGIYGREKYIIRKLRAIHFNMADLILVYSSYSERLLILNGINKSKIKIIGNQLPDAEQYRILEKVQNKAKELNLIFVGRISKKKKIDLVIKLVQNWSSKHQFSVNLTIIGPNTKSFKKKKFYNSSIIYIPAIYEPENLNRYYSKNDYGICPDNVGLFCLSCILTGIPIITHNNLAYHGPESSSLKINENIIEIEFPVNLKDLEDKIVKAYYYKTDQRFSPFKIRKTLPYYFESNYPEKVIKEIF
tara:strand:- start:34278 stop:35426 length:1149 start_codon:yes stop_codon:yes gene_type:complete